MIHSHRVIVCWMSGFTWFISWEFRLSIRKTGTIQCFWAAVQFLEMSLEFGNLVFRVYFLFFFLDIPDIYEASRTNTPFWKVVMEIKFSILERTAPTKAYWNTQKHKWPCYKRSIDSIMLLNIRACRNIIAFKTHKHNSNIFSSCRELQGKRKAYFS